MKLTTHRNLVLEIKKEGANLHIFSWYGDHLIKDKWFLVIAILGSRKDDVVRRYCSTWFKDDVVRRNSSTV